MPITTGSQVSQPDGRALRFRWLAIPNGNQGDPVTLNTFQDRTVQVTGTFGAGGSVSIQGSNDGGTTWVTLTDPLGNALTFTAAGLKQITELPYQIRPNVTAGDGSTALNVWMHARIVQMSTIRENVQTLKTQGRIFRAIFELADQIESADQVDQMVGEANARLKAKEAEEKGIDARLAEASAKVKSAQDRALKSAEKARSISEDAESEKHRILMDAQAEADAIVSAAKANAEEARASAEQAKSEAVSGAVEKQAELAEITKRVDAATKELADIEAKIAAARASAKQILGE